MAHGCEVRAAFLKSIRRAGRICFSLPAQLKMHEGWTKFLLRKTMEKAAGCEIPWRRREKAGLRTAPKNWMKEPVMQDYILEAARKLVNAGILTKKSPTKKN
ncbi:MAG: hypothetical protein IPI54_08540 [Chitinophagaceae bacterium]|nr:hypothetical protein [Chitinophagaceae bacterium]